MDFKEYKSFTYFINLSYIEKPSVDAERLISLAPEMAKFIKILMG